MSPVGTAPPPAQGNGTDIFLTRPTGRPATTLNVDVGTQSRSTLSALSPALPVKLHPPASSGQSCTACLHFTRLPHCARVVTCVKNMVMCVTVSVHVPTRTRVSAPPMTDIGYVSVVPLIGIFGLLLMQFSSFCGRRAPAQFRYCRKFALVCTKQPTALQNPTMTPSTTRRLQK